MGNFVTSNHVYATLTATYYVWKLANGIYNITCLQENTTTRQLWLALTCLAVKEKLNTFLRTVSNLFILLSMVCVCRCVVDVYTYTVYDCIRTTFHVTIQPLVMMTFVLQNGWSPLNAASDNGHLDIVETLLEAGANINQATQVQ